MAPRNVEQMRCVVPIYEYQCKNCGHQLEAFQSLSEAPLTDCPSCGKPDLTKLVSAAGLQFKGSGWYLTDYSDKGKAKAQEKAKQEGSDSSSSSNSSSSGGTAS